MSLIAANPRHHDWLGLQVTVTYVNGHTMTGRMKRWDGTNNLVTIDTPWNCEATARAERIVLVGE